MTPASHWNQSESAGPETTTEEAARGRIHGALRPRTRVWVTQLEKEPLVHRLRRTTAVDRVNRGSGQVGSAFSHTDVYKACVSSLRNLNTPQNVASSAAS
ncbi:hypothetical protein HPB50_022536 [Hyalomma asiaticum]|uniref:Uncharacterized protein n=1 Tax=Hyalomma asiaticum TaxID=266040 RepID=A0ACB7S541_HYAAI|nr:hypothetical protein HPB50_022536 [Hyalomma asiaticum]